jgi:hypothetical protein
MSMKNKKDMGDIKPYPKNAPGGFVVDDGYCIQCCAPQAEAPDLMDNDGTSCYFQKQPVTPNEVERAIKAVCVSCCGAVRYVGDDVGIALRIKEIVDEGDRARIERDREKLERMRQVQRHALLDNATPLGDMQRSDIQAAIDDLRFHPRWFEYGLLPLDFFERQLEIHRTDPNVFWQSLEHHRYGAFQAVLSSYESFSDEQVEHYIELCQLDEDPAMAQAALMDLLEWDNLSEVQYDGLTRHPAYVAPVAQKIIWRNRMHAKLQEESVTDDVFAEILSRQDSVFERALVCAPGLSRQQCEVLAEKGGTRVVRNMAINRLGRRVTKRRL